MDNFIEIEFVKMTGAGNDFVLFDLRGGDIELNWTALAPRLCDRRYGIGADGLLILKLSTKADFLMEYYNADGSYGGMCGNGGRCAALYVLNEREIKEVSFEALDHIYQGSWKKTDIKLRMKDPKHMLIKKLKIFDDNIIAHYIDTGTAHCVLFMDELSQTVRAKIESSGINAIGSEIRNHNIFAPAGTNVDFVEVINGNTISMRTYERGVENETLACGTGAIASSVTASLLKGVNSPVQVRTRSNEILSVEFDKVGEKITNVSLVGPAKIIFRGTYTVTL